MLDCSHKTVIVLDHGPLFARACGEVILEGKEGSAADSIEIQKSLWTCSVEAGLEYLRLVGDLFPDSRALLRFVVSDFVGRNLTPSWAPKGQALDHVLELLAGFRSPDGGGDPEACSIVNGVSMAVEALSLVSEVQKAALKKKKRKGPVRNHGRLIVISAVNDPEEIALIESHVLEQLESRNKSNLDENSLPIERLEFCLVNVIPANESLDPSLVSRPLQATSSPVLWSEFRSSLGGAALSKTIQGLAISHFSLASTTVTSIPMKEEQTSGQSANYDVELLHHKSGHADLQRLGLLEGGESLLVDGPNGYKTLTLRWCSPNAKAGLNADQLFVCSSVSRVTPSAVNSRPSACLTQFLLSGRTVMLEVPRKAGQGPMVGLGTMGTGGKPISHLLTCHAGLIFIHALAQGRSPLDEPPSISEGPGGKVGDYRIAAFAEFMREHQLGPADSPHDDDKPPNKQARILLALETPEWPMTLGDSLLAALAQTASAMQAWLAPMLATGRRWRLVEADEALIRDCFFKLIHMQAQAEPLPAAAIAATRLKGLKREEQYGILYSEVETWLRSQSFRSPQHLNNLNVWLHTCRKPIQPSVLGTDDPKREAALMVEESGLWAAEESGEAEEGEVAEAKRPRTDVPRLLRKIVRPAPKTLLDVYETAYKARWAGWRDFEGRKEADGKPAVLYQDLLAKDAELKAGQVEME